MIPDVGFNTDQSGIVSFKDNQNTFTAENLLNNIDLMRQF